MAADVRITTRGLLALGRFFVVIEVLSKSEVEGAARCRLLIIRSERRPGLLIGEGELSIRLCSDDDGTICESVGSVLGGEAPISNVGDSSDEKMCIWARSSRSERRPGLLRVEKGLRAGKVLV